MADRMKKCIACGLLHPPSSLFCECGGVVVTVSQLAAMKTAHGPVVAQQKAMHARRLVTAYGVTALKWVAIGACLGLGFRLAQFAAW